MELVNENLASNVKKHVLDIRSNNAKALIYKTHDCLIARQYAFCVIKEEKENIKYIERFLEIIPNDKLTTITYNGSHWELGWMDGEIHWGLSRNNYLLDEESEDSN